MKDLTVYQYVFISLLIYACLSSVLYTCFLGFPVTTSPASILPIK